MPPQHHHHSWLPSPPQPSPSSSPAVTLSHLKPSNLLNYESTHLVLIVFDGTWKHAKEMVSGSEGFLGKFAMRVCLDAVGESVEGGTIYDSELVLRKEPFGGCVSTFEAVVRCLGVVVPNGVEIERTLIGVLREMLRLQARFLKPRPRMLNVEEGEAEGEGEE